MATSAARAGRAVLAVMVAAAAWSSVACSGEAWEVCWAVARTAAAAGHLAGVEASEAAKADVGAVVVALGVLVAAQGMEVRAERWQAEL